MKKTHIIGIVLIAISIGVIMSTIVDSSTYAPFSEVVSNPDEEFQVVGELNKEKSVVYEPQVDANLFTFYMIDREGNEQQVFFHGNKPQDFERSEQLVVTGKYTNNEFHANKILMKCPSKYNNGQEVEVTASTNS
jgi:cytochrome c-type biogenesis protein CcmE